MASTPAVAPNLDSVALVCLLLSSDGVIRWGNAAGQAIGRSSPGKVGHLNEFVHPDDRALAGDLVDEAVNRGHAERTIRTLSAETGKFSYLHCILSRTVTGDGPTSGVPEQHADVDMILQGWDVTKRVIRERELEQQAHRDPLTGAANRLAFMTRLEQELSMSRLPSSGVAVLYAEVDDFKRVNDEYGHEAGDRVLAEMAGRLHRSLRSADLLGRLGGDEFAIICPDVFGWSSAVALIERLRCAAAVPIASRDGEIFVSLSLGVAFADQRDDRRETAVALLARAGEQMFSGKLQPREPATGAIRSSVDAR